MLNQASPDPGIYIERITIVLGVLSLVSVLATLASCRSCVSFLTRLGWRNPLNSGGYKAFYRYHTIYWWVFGVSILSHIMLAILHTGLPQADDPDAYIHWQILILGLVSFISSTTIFSSCRLYSRIRVMVSPHRPEKHAYQIYFKYHAYYWLVFLALVAAHFATGYSHAGIWPGG